MQEVQKTLDYKAELNLIEWVWHQENRIKEHTQVEAAWWSECNAVSDTIDLFNYDETFATSWTLTVNGWVDYKTSWGDIVIPLAWPYLLEYIPNTWYPQDSFYYTIKIYVDWEEIYSLRTSLWDRTTRNMVVNLWKRNKITASLTKEFSAAANVPVTLNLKKI
jgi:hypothetical protein